MKLFVNLHVYSSCLFFRATGDGKRPCLWLVKFEFFQQKFDSLKFEILLIVRTHPCDRLQIKAKSPELENIWINMKNKLSETFDNMNVNSETTEQMNQLRAKFQEGVQTLVKESENTAKTISENSSKVQEDLGKFMKQAIDIAVQAAQNMNNQLQQATTSAP